MEAHASKPQVREGAFICSLIVCQEGTVRGLDFLEILFHRSHHPQNFSILGITPRILHELCSWLPRKLSKFCGRTCSDYISQKIQANHKLWANNSRFFLVSLLIIKDMIFRIAQFLKNRSYGVYLAFTRHFPFDLQVGTKFIRFYIKFKKPSLILSRQTSTANFRT